MDACTIQECLHSFCKSCIVRYLESKKNCPVCRVLIHKTRPLQNVRPDPTLQDVVYKLVPGILKNEMMRRRRFYAEHPCAGTEGNPTWSEDRGDIIDPERAIFMEDDKISVALIHSPDGKPAPESSSSITTRRSQGCGSAGIAGQTLGTCYLFCPAMVTIGVLKKLIRYKFDLHPEDDLIDIFQSDESLSEEYTLMDIVYLYTWRRQGPLCLFFTIYKFRPACPSSSARSEESHAARSQVTSGAAAADAGRPAAEASPDASAQEEPLNMSKKRKLDAALVGADVAGSDECWASQDGTTLPQQRPALQRQPSSQLPAAAGEQLPTVAARSATAIGAVVAAAPAPGLATVIGRPLVTAAPASAGACSAQPAPALAKVATEAAVVVGGMPMTAAASGGGLAVLGSGGGNRVVPEQHSGGSGGSVANDGGGASRASAAAAGIAACAGQLGQVDNEDEPASVLNLCISRR